MINNLTLSCRLVADPEIKFVGDANTPVLNFRVANDTGWGDNKKANFFNVTAWRGLAEVISNYKKKGDQILLTGELQYREYEDSQGNNRNTVEILARDVEFVGSRGETAPASGGTTTAVASDAGDTEVPF